MHVGVVALIIAGQRVDHTPGLVGGRPVIEVNEGLAANELVKRRKVETKMWRE
jgi:hypothetical protein